MWVWGQYARGGRAVIIFMAIFLTLSQQRGLSYGNREGAERERIAARIMEGDGAFGERA